MTEFINAKLHQHLQSLRRNLPQADIAQAANTLIDSLLYALANGESPQQLIKRIRRERYKKPMPLSPLASAQAITDIHEVKRLRAIAKAKPIVPGARKLDRYRQEVEQLRKSGASHIDIKFWLLANRGTKVSQPTIHRYLKVISKHEISTTE